MSKILFIKSGALGDGSATNQLLDAAMAQAQARGDAVVVRDVAELDLPHIDAHYIQASRTAVEDLSLTQSMVLSVSDTLIQEVLDADVLVIGAPMYNLSIPSSLKAYLDRIVRSGVTFRYGPAGPVGLLSGKRAVVVVGSSGVYSQGPAAAVDFVAPYMKAVLGFIGISQVELVRAEGLAGGESARHAALTAAQSELAEAL